MYRDDKKDELAPFLSLRENLDPDPAHSAQVAKLALDLFDNLSGLHRLGAKERLLLHAAALCHDVGLVRGEKAHHKTSRDILLAQQIPGVSPVKLIIIALTARYHRKALPGPKHRYYKELSRANQLRVRKLAGILRIADGLDRTHTGVVQGLSVADDGETVRIQITTRHDASLERLVVAEKKQGLFEKVFARKLEIVEIPKT